MPTIPEEIPPWRAVLYDGHSVGLAQRARMLFRVGIEPACATIAGELSSLERGPDGDAIRHWDNLRDAQLELHRSLAAGVGGMWERHFRRHLSHSAAVIIPGSKALQKDIERGEWTALMRSFERVRGFPLSKFASYPELALLYDVTSAVRHGNGPATERLYAAHPDLFSHEPIRSWHSYFTLGGEPPHSIHNLDILLQLLSAFTEAVADFWETVRELQKTSKT